MKMISVKIAELSGPALDWAVAYVYVPVMWGPAVQDGEVFLRNASPEYMQPYKPSTDWSQGGPLLQPNQVIFRHHAGGIIEACCMFGEIGMNRGRSRPMKGPDYLIAAMRAIVASRAKGDIIEVPAELLGESK